MTDLVNIIIILQHFFISSIGMIGNLLVLIVYKKQLKDNQSITFFIVHLALTDLACCLFVIPINCYHELNIGKISSDFMCKFHSFLNIINITYSCLLMTLVAFERFFSIIYPFKKIITKLRSKIIMLFLLSLCLAIALAGCLSIGIFHKVVQLPSINRTSNMSGLIDFKLPKKPKTDSAKNSLSLDRTSRKINKRETSIYDAEFFDNIAFEHIINTKSNQNDEKYDIYDNKNEFSKTPVAFMSVSNFSSLYFNVSNLPYPLTPVYSKQLSANNALVEIYNYVNENGEQRFYFTIKNKDEVKIGELNGLDSFLANRDRRDLYSSYNNVTFVWMATNHCFPNDKIISIDFFPYIRLFQNFIVVGCFAVIFILYAFICIFVSRRRQLKVNRANYYKDILFRSKQNANGFKSELPMSNSNSLIGLSDLTKKSAEQNGKNKSKLIVFDKTNKQPLLHSNEVTTEHDEFKTVHKTISNDSILNDTLALPNQNENENNDKSTQTVSSSIAKMKYNQSLKKTKPIQPKIKINDHGHETVFDNTNYNVSYSNTLLANLKTAFMLFVVTIVMAIVYTPALLTSLGYLSYNPLHWNIIYINNAANPLVYSFLNSNFRKSLKKTFLNCFNRLI